MLCMLFATIADMRNLFVVLVMLSTQLGSFGLVSVAARSAAPVKTTALRDEVTEFLTRELSAHLSAIKSYNPPPVKVFNASATGQFTWGTFMRALGSYAELAGKRTLAERDLAREVGQIGLLEYRLGGKRFSQLYAALALRSFGKDLSTNPVWQSLSADERVQWTKLLDVSTFYDPQSQQVIYLAENYLSVAARIASVSYQLGLTRDRAALDAVIDRAATPFTSALYADDAPPTGRFDRYSNEYLRFVWDAAQTAGRNDILHALKPSLRAQMNLWWDLVSPDGYGYGWGRSLGAVSYVDTIEIVAFLAAHPEFRPAPLEQLASAYYQAWNWLRRDYNNNSHTLSVFAFGRGNYAYIKRDREWQQTMDFLGKAALAHQMFTEALSRENVSEFSSEIVRRDLTRFEFFRRGERPAGAWLVRRGLLYFTLPITTGTQPGVADYLPAPHGLANFAAPVEQVYPSLVPFLELADGRVLVAADGADEIEPAPDGRKLRAVWKRWALVGGKSGEFVDPHITSTVVWRIDGTTLKREESLLSSENVYLRRWWFAVPTTASSQKVKAIGRENRARLESKDTALEIRVSADWPLKVSLLTTGGGPLGRGEQGHIPQHLVYEAEGFRMTANRPARWTITLKVERKR